MTSHTDHQANHQPNHQADDQLDHQRGRQDHPSGRQDRPSARAGVGRRRIATVVVATLAGLLVWVVADPIAGVDLTVGSGAGARQVGAGAVVATGLIAGLAAVGLAAVLGRRVRRSRRTWTIIAVAVLILSLAGPLGGASAGVVLALVAMHLVVGGILILGTTGTLVSGTEQHA